ncbi:MAG: long-chain fatty acid--CoA ligase [Flavobacteriaceae bacterium]|nr:long-chain fatty acid--CoA ligase [Flavobacteriaceae bacterium]
MSNEIKRTFDIPYQQLKRGGLDTAFSSKHDGKWIKTSTKEFIEKANNLSRALLKMGVKKNDKIGVISSNNRTEWCIVDMAVLQIGAQNVPIYPNISEEGFKYIFDHSEIIYCFLSDQALYDKVVNIKDDVKNLKDIYSFDEIENCKNWTSLLTLDEDREFAEDLEEKKDSVKPEDMATIIYTSGTEGNPKGVMLSHDNLISNVLASTPRIPVLGPDSIVMSFLPVCHVFERILLYVYQQASISIHFAESIEKVGVNIKEIKPNFMSVVPRLIEKIYESIHQKGLELTGVKKMLFFWAVSVGEQYKPYDENGWFYALKLKIARKLIFSKWIEALGGNLKCLVSGSAALQPRLIRIFTAAGMGIMEGYGLSETSPVVTVNMVDDKHFKIGSVGKVIPKVEVKIAEDGEILVKGPNVMMGYFKDETKTKEVMNNGYFHTGDKGNLDKDGFLTITGRKKEIFKTSGGKYISPVLIENEVKESRFVEQIMVLGDGQKMATAIIQPNFEFVSKWAEAHGINSIDTNEELIKNTKVIARIAKEVEAVNNKLNKWETIKKFELISEVWSVDNGLLTPTLKPKRRIIFDKYKHLNDKMYN